MPTWNSYLDLYDHQKAAFEAVNRSARQTYRQLGEGAFKDLRELTGGSIDQKTLRRMGSPYARGGPGAVVARGVSKGYAQKQNLKSTKGLAPLLPINRQSGRLQQSIRIVHRSMAYAIEDSVFFDPGVAGSSLWAVSPNGTSKVVPRGLWVEVRKRAAIRQRAFRDVFYSAQADTFRSPSPSARPFTVLPEL